MLDFAFLSTTDWDAPQFGSRQQIAGALARRGHRVLFVEVPRALHSLVSDPEGTRRAIPRMGRVRQVVEGLEVYTPPPVLPAYYHPAVNAVNQRLLRRYVAGVLRSLSRTPDVLWTYWPNTAHLVGRLGERASVYHCIDDFTAVDYPLSPAGAIALMEAEQCRRVDLVFARSALLADRTSLINPETHLLAGGVDINVFDPDRVGATRPDVSALPGPRAGMVGTLDDRVDVELLAQCAAAMPDVSFVLVGPVKRHRVDVGPLAAHGNVSLLPPCAPGAVPGIVAAFDVCLIPYVVNGYTRALSPIKLYEYLAMGQQVISTDLPYVQRERSLVAIARSREEFVLAVQNSLGISPSEVQRARWRRAACNNTWDSQVDAIEGHLGRVLGGRR